MNDKNDLSNPLAKAKLLSELAETKLQQFIHGDGTIEEESASSFTSSCISKSRTDHSMIDSSLNLHTERLM